MKKNPAVMYAVAATLVVTVLGLQFAGVFAHDTAPQGATDPAPAASVTVAPSVPDGGNEEADATEPAAESVEDTVPGFDERVAVKAAVARSTWSWEDDGPSEWTDRLAALSTDDYADQLGDLPVTAVEESDWERGVVAPEAVSKVTGVTVQHLDGSAASGTVDVVVRYRVEVAYGRPDLVDAHAGEGSVVERVVPGAGEWVELYAQEVNMRFVFDGRRWLLDATAYPA